MGRLQSSSDTFFVSARTVFDFWFLPASRPNRAGFLNRVWGVGAHLGTDGCLWHVRHMAATNFYPLRSCLTIGSPMPICVRDAWQQPELSEPFYSTVPRRIDRRACGRSDRFPDALTNPACCLLLKNTRSRSARCPSLQQSSSNSHYTLSSGELCPPIDKDGSLGRNSRLQVFPQLHEQLASQRDDPNSSHP